MSPGERSEAVSVQYPLPGGVTLTVAGRSRLEPAEALFAADADNQTLATLLLDAVMQVRHTQRAGSPRVRPASTPSLHRPNSEPVQYRE